MLFKLNKTTPLNKFDATGPNMRKTPIKTVNDVKSVFYKT